MPLDRREYELAHDMDEWDEMEWAPTEVNSDDLSDEGEDEEEAQEEKGEGER